MSTATVDIPSALLDEVKRFRLAKSKSGMSALIVKIDKKQLVAEIEDKFEQVELDELLEEVPENSPRFIVVSYELKHRDGRVSYPLFILYWAPPTSSIDLSTLYASALSIFCVKTDIAKVVDVRDGELSKQSLEERLGF